MKKENSVISIEFFVLSAFDRRDDIFNGVKNHPPEKRQPHFFTIIVRAFILYV